MISIEEYKQNPCEALSIPYWKATDIIIPDNVKRNLQDAYHAHLAMTDNGSDKNAETVLEQCDDEFYKSEDEINCILKKYAAKMEL